MVEPRRAHRTHANQDHRIREEHHREQSKNIHISENISSQAEWWGVQNSWNIQRETGRPYLNIISSTIGTGAAGYKKSTTTGEQDPAHEDKHNDSDDTISKQIDKDICCLVAEKLAKGFQWKPLQGVADNFLSIFVDIRHCLYLFPSYKNMHYEQNTFTNKSFS